MGGLRKYMPVTFWTMRMATFAIAGIPPLAGFFSKDEILWMAYISPHGSWMYLADRRDHRFYHFLLHVPSVVHDFLRRLPRNLRSRRTWARRSWTRTWPAPRKSLGDAGSARGSRDPLVRRRMGWDSRTTSSIFCLPYFMLVQRVSSRGNRRGREANLLPWSTWK